MKQLLSVIGLTLIVSTGMAQPPRVDLVYPVDAGSRRMGPIRLAGHPQGGVVVATRVSDIPSRTVDHSFPGDPPIKQRLTTLMHGFRVSRRNASGKELWRFDVSAFHENPYSGSTIYNWDIVVDNNGNSYVAAEFQGAVLIDTVIAGKFPQDGHYAAALFKLDPRGRLLWAHQFHTGANPPSVHLAIEREGDVALTMSFTGSHHWWSTDISVSANGSLVARLAPDGNARWLKWYDGSGGLWLQPAFAPDGGLAVVGHFHGEQRFGDVTLQPRSYPGHRWGPNVYPLNNPGSIGPNCMFVARYHRDGEVLWTRQVEGTGVTYGSVNPAAVAVGRNGDVVIAGYGDGMFFVDSTTFFDAPTEMRGQPTHLILVRYNRHGKLLWATRTKGKGSFLPMALSIDPGGNAVVVGNLLAPNLLCEGAKKPWGVQRGTVPLLLAFSRDKGREIWGLVGEAPGKKRNDSVNTECSDLVTDPDGHHSIGIGAHLPMRMGGVLFDKEGVFVVRLNVRSGK